MKEKFPVLGFVKDPTGVAALYLGKREGKDLVYMGMDVRARRARCATALHAHPARQLSELFGSRA